MMILEPAFLGLGALIVLLGSAFVLLNRRGRQEIDGGDKVREQLKQRGQAQAEFAMATEQAMIDLKTSVEGLATCLANLEMRMRAVDQRQRKLDEQSAQLMRRHGFEEALRLVQQGQSSQDIARRCGLPMAEAELLRRLHGQSISH